MTHEFLFTVFTPTYNRKDTLPRVYQSLQKQTFRDFEWVIIDDGSTDDTEEMVKEWQREADFKIKYQWQENQGKHIAYNRAGEIAKGKLFLIIDSDDETSSVTLERLKYHWDRLSESQKTYVGGISFLGQNQFGELIGNRFPKDYEISGLMEMYFLKDVKGDKGAVLQIEALNQFPFPEIKNVVIPESTFMYQYSKKWKMCFINESLSTFWIENRSDSLSKATVQKKNYRGTLYGHMSFLNNNMRFFLKRPKLCMGEATRYAALSFQLKDGIRKQWTNLQPASAKLLWMCMLPLGYLFFIKNKNAPQQ